MSAKVGYVTLSVSDAISVGVVGCYGDGDGGSIHCPHVVCEDGQLYGMKSSR